MNILITGAEGFVGKNLKEFFENKKKYIIFTPTIKDLDLTDSQSVKNYFSNNEIQYIIHSATTEPEDKIYPEDVCEKNLKMFCNIYKYKAKDTFLINLGSGSEYSRPNWMPQMKEEYFDKYIPQDGHSYAKYLISKIISLSKDKTLINLRIFGIFGKFEDYTNKFISNCITRNLIGLPIKINQNVIYDYLYIKDFCKILEYFIENKPVNNTMNVTPTESVDLISINDYIQLALKIKPKIEVIKKGYGREYTGDNSILLKNLGNYEFTPIKESISELIDYFKENMSLIDRNKLLENNFLEYAKKIN